MNHTEVSESTKQRILEEILESEDFRQAQKYQELLRYLVRTAINGEAVKEATIAVEFFSKDAAFDPAMDSSVRAYISNLRRKLDHYYLTKGKDDDIRLAIPKGHYNVEFIQTSNRQKLRSPMSRKRLGLLYIPLVLLALFAAIAIWQSIKPPRNIFNFISAGSQYYRKCPDSSICQAHTLYNTEILFLIHKTL